MAVIFEPRFSPGAPDPVSIATRYHYWAASAAYPGLLKSLYIVRSPTDVLRLDRVSEAFVPDSWPDVLSPAADFGTGRGFFPRDTQTDLLVVPLNRRPPGGWGGWRGPGADVPHP